ncbi:hypothetical protein MP619_00985 [Streptococcus dysgalactiae]|uniref:Phage protein n=1 Tax=Streptococcus dysgalactiae TaxID=1334 RepID=A0AAE9UM71_STRDY|nr:hypothetical protein [Streptococcus dysgalactiae]HEP2841425.1 hypothetical protein [Streptococcus pyogenes]QGH05083.1 hypothetical protein EA458_11910 [Streptococcus dysgalactiae subsp. dysgalactiae]WAI93228.1 hypothetical protein MP619_00985 [Streptococcus dysgalactiae]WCE86326.1 hypothetical protein PMN45_01710 [Streptococcus dysgalactiae]WCN26320.1 hypothetical protein PP188_01715 [Streptococcus dysgalactiae]
MSKYAATKKLILAFLGVEIDAGETIEIEDEYAEQVNKDLKLTFPDVEAVLVPVSKDETIEIEDEKPKKATRKKKSDAEIIEDDAAEK